MSLIDEQIGDKDPKMLSVSWNLLREIFKNTAAIIRFGNWSSSFPATLSWVSGALQCIGLTLGPPVSSRECLKVEGQVCGIARLLTLWGICFTCNLECCLTGRHYALRNASGRFILILYHWWRFQRRGSWSWKNERERDACDERRPYAAGAGCQNYGRAGGGRTGVGAPRGRLGESKQSLHALRKHCALERGKAFCRGVPLPRRLPKHAPATPLHLPCVLWSAAHTQPHFPLPWDLHQRCFCKYWGFDETRSDALFELEFVHEDDSINCFVFCVMYTLYVTDSVFGEGLLIPL